MRSTGARLASVALAFACFCPTLRLATPAVRDGHGSASPRQASGAAADCPGGSLHPFGSWVEADVLPFPREANPLDRPQQVITAFAVDPTTPGRLFVTNGQSVLRSTNYGCSWQPVFQVATPQLGSTQAEAIQGIVAAGGNYVYLAVYAAGRIAIYASSNGGASYSEADTGLADYSYSPGELVAGPANPRQVYLMQYGGVLATSSNGGASWTATTANLTAALASGNGSSYSQASLLAEDPGDANVVYLWQGGSLYRSADGAQTFSQIGSPDAKVAANPGALAVLHPSGQPASLLFTDGSRLYLCNADCSVEGSVAGPPNVGSITAGGSSTFAILGLADNGGLDRYDLRTHRVTAITPYPNTDTTGGVSVNGTTVSGTYPQASSAGVFYAQTPWNIYRYVGH